MKHQHASQTPILKGIVFYIKSDFFLFFFENNNDSLLKMNLANMIECS